MPKACPYGIIISAKGIYRAALLTSIRNFADFETSRSCVVVNAFLDVNGGLCLRGCYVERSEIASELEGNVGLKGR